MTASTAVRMATVGAGLIAITYGLSRFAFGLFVPAIREDLGLSAAQMGLIGALPFASFALASLLAPVVANRLGARNAATIAGGLVLVGLILVATATSAVMLGGGVFACGVATGLMMPALATGVRAAIRTSVQGRVTAVMNAGTSLGVALAFPAVLLLGGAWRAGYASFAVLAAVGMVAAWTLLPSASRVPAADRPPLTAVSGWQWFGLFRLSFFAFGMGVASAAYWMFAPDLVVHLGDGPEDTTGWLWVAVGVAGLAGGGASDLCDRHGAAITQAAALIAMAAATSLIAASPNLLPIMLVSAAVFGMAYMTLTGLYLLSGIRLLPERPSWGPVLPFLAVAVGQAVGSPLAGWLVNRLGHADAFSVFATLGLVFALISPLYPRVEAPTDAEEEHHADEAPAPSMEPAIEYS